MNYPVEHIVTNLLLLLYAEKSYSDKEKQRFADAFAGPIQVKPAQNIYNDCCSFNNMSKHFYPLPVDQA